MAVLLPDEPRLQRSYVGSLHQSVNAGEQYGPRERDEYVGELHAHGCVGGCCI